MNEIIEAPQHMPAESAPMRMLELAVRSSAPVETLERLMAMHERHEANEARKAYVVAMNAYHAEGIQVFKDKNVDQGISRKSGAVLPKYSHATLANITSTVTPVLARHGLSVSWSSTQPGDGFVEVTCTIRHSLGHSESVTLKGPYDVTGGKNDIQAVGSAATYLQRYTVTAILGISALDQDDDGDKGGEKKLSDEVQELVAYLTPFAQNGLAAYAAQYRTISAADRKLLPAAEHEKLKAMANAADYAERGNGNA